MKSSLYEIQQQFLSSILGKASKFNSMVVATDKPSLKTRIAIYKEGYSTRLTNALAANYPLLKNYIGSQKFITLAQAYIENHPSSYNSIRYLGEHLADFLKQTQTYRKRPVLSELAQLEWAIGESNDAVNLPSIDIDQLRKIPWEQWAEMKIMLHPSLRLVKCEYNIRRVLQNPAILPRKLNQDEIVVVWRNNFVVRYRKLTQIEAFAIDCTRHGQDFAKICEGINKMTTDSAAKCAKLVLHWVLDGLISGVEIGEK